MSLELGRQVFGPALLDPDKHAALAPIIDKVPFVEAINDAWRLVALATLECSLLPPWQDAPRTRNLSPRYRDLKHPLRVSIYPTTPSLPLRDGVPGSFT